jgi:hypothetical protein
MKRVLVVVFALLALVGLSACDVPLKTGGNTAKIEFLATTTQGGWRYDYYRNNAYPCSVSGYQTFVVGRKVGSIDADARPLWVFMHGGGAGYFDENGNPIPSRGQKIEEDFDNLKGRLTNGGLLKNIRNDAAGFRTLAVSMCSHDIYAGMNTVDPHNANTTPDGKARPTTGLISTKAAIQFVQKTYPTTKTFLHGGSAGSVGTFNVAWSMQLQGIAPAGIVADASLINVEARQASFAAGICTQDNTPERVAGIAGRVHPDLANPANEIDKIVADGRFTVPIMHIWNHGDVNTCGAAPVACPLRDGTTATMGITDCMHQPLQAAIAAQGAASRSKNLPVCVDTDEVKGDCSTHVVTTKPGFLNTDPASPADYFSAIVDWVHTRLADA